jgi:hypothetical protein
MVGHPRGEDAARPAVEAQGTLDGGPIAVPGDLLNVGGDRAPKAPRCVISPGVKERARRGSAGEIDGGQKHRRKPGKEGEELRP